MTVGILTGRVIAVHLSPHMTDTSHQKSRNRPERYQRQDVIYRRLVVHKIVNVKNYRRYSLLKIEYSYILFIYLIQLYELLFFYYVRISMKDL